MSQPKILSDAFGKPLKDAGFKKKRADTWYFTSEDAISVLNLQKSDYGAKYYVNVAVWLKALGDAEAPAEHHCHIRLRWKELIPEDEEELAALLDLESRSISDGERIGRIQHLLRTYIIPFLQTAQSVERLRSVFGTDRWPVCLVNRRAQELLAREA